jgi:hypothetical protein
MKYLFQQPTVESPSDVEKTSRSGRKIKQKKFDDEHVSAASQTPSVNFSSFI